MIETRFVSQYKNCTYIEPNIDVQKVWPVPECGKPTFNKHAYCEHHYRICYEPPKKKRVKK